MPGEPHPSPADLPPFLVLYDGSCGLCGRTVAWLIRRDARQELAFAPLQGKTAAALRRIHPAIPDAIDSLVYLEPGGVHLRSRAILRLARHLDRPWCWAHVLRGMPAAPLDLVYRLVARVRHRIRGPGDVCRVPEEGTTGRFLP